MTSAADLPPESQSHDDEQTEFIDMPGVRSTPREPILTVIAGVCTGLNALVEGKPLLMGRDRDCQLVLEGSGFSRKHARVQQDLSGEVVIDEMGSTNGTFVDGQRITQHLLWVVSIFRPARTRWCSASCVQPRRTTKNRRTWSTA